MRRSGCDAPPGAYGKAKVFLRARSTRASTSGGKRPSRLTRRRLSTALICSVTALEGKVNPAVPFGITAWLGDTRAVFFVSGTTTASSANWLIPVVGQDDHWPCLLDLDPEGGIETGENDLTATDDDHASPPPPGSPAPRDH